MRRRREDQENRKEAEFMVPGYFTKAVFVMRAKGSAEMIDLMERRGPSLAWWWRCGVVLLERGFNFKCKIRRREGDLFVVRKELSICAG